MNSFDKIALINNPCSHTCCMTGAVAVASPAASSVSPSVPSRLTMSFSSVSAYRDELLLSLMELSPAAYGAGGDGWVPRSTAEVEPPGL